MDGGADGGADAGIPPYCANTQQDDANCGACGNACPETTYCYKGNCTAFPITFQPGLYSNWTVPATGVYLIDAVGGSGGQGGGLAGVSGGPGGLGLEVKATFMLDAGTHLTILVGTG